MAAPSLENTPEAINFQRSFSIEQKSFKVEHRASTIRLTEIRDRYSSYALFPCSLGEWISSTVEEAVSAREGLLSNKTEGELSVYITKKKNSKGRLISLMFLSPKIKSGAKFIVCPEGREGIGWKNLADSIRAVSAHATSSLQSMIRAPHGSEMVIQKNNNKQKQRQGKQKHGNKKGGPVTLLVKISQGLCVMNQIPSMIHKLIRLSSTPEISATEDSQIFRLRFSTSSDVNRLGEIASLQLKNCSLEFIQEKEEESTPDIPDIPWTDITTRQVNLWGLPASAITPENIALFITDFGAFRTLEVLDNDEEGMTGVRVTIDHSDLSLMPQLKYIDWEEDVHGIRIIPVREKQRRRGKKKRRGVPTRESPESSKAAEERGKEKVTTEPDTHGRQDQQLLLLQSTADTNTTRQASPQASMPDHNVRTANALVTPGSSTPTFADVLRGSPRPVRGAEKAADNTTPTTSRIADLNKSPMASPNPSPEPNQGDDTVLQSIIRIGDILGYDESEKQSMVNRYRGSR